MVSPRTTSPSLFDYTHLALLLVGSLLKGKAGSQQGQEAGTGGAESDLVGATGGVGTGGGCGARASLSTGPSAVAAGGARGRGLGAADGVAADRPCGSGAGGAADGEEERADARLLARGVRGRVGLSAVALRALGRAFRRRVDLRS